MPKSEKLKDPEKCELRVKLNEMRKQNMFCDITFQVGGREFRAHKAVLSAISCYFETMFTGGFKEGTAQEIEINGNADSFELMLEFIYTGKLHLFVENDHQPSLVCGFLDMACYMQMDDAIEKCTNFVNYIYDRSNYPGNYTIYSYHRPKLDSSDSESNYDINEDEEEPVTVADAYYYLLFAKMRDHELSNLAILSEEFLQVNLEELKTCDDILAHASVEFMEEFLSDENLALSDEEIQVLHFVISWLKFDWPARQSYAYRVLQKVRLGLVNSSIRIKLFDNAICAIPECKNLLDKVKNIENGQLRLVEQRYPELFATRSTVMVAVSGHASHRNNPESQTFFEYFDVTTQDWKSIDGFQDLKKDLENHSLCYVDSLDLLYLAGGSERQRRSGLSRSMFNCSSCDDRGVDCTCQFEDVPQRCFFSTDGISNQWKELPPMLNSRTHFPLVHLGKYLYAIGGTPGDCNLSDVEYYDTGISQGKWKYAAPLPSCYFRISAVAFNEIILAYGFGGFRNELNIYYPKCNNHLKVLKCDECRDSKSDDDDDEDFRCNTWHEVSSVEWNFGDYRCDPILFVHNSVCYRIVHIVPSFSKISRPVVNIVNVEQYIYSNKKKVTIGQAVNQDYIPYNAVGAFRIKDQVFATKHVSVFDTGIRIAEDQKSDVDLGKIEAVFKRSKGIGTSIVKFTFDKRLLDDYE